ncbi:MAG TPA: MarR family transcriptional regulator [Candidatus Rubrimentiphilum sp.]|nr:MarR family transcriptional regulator [Candidatus Rubrimentiphilum sp.]
MRLNRLPLSALLSQALIAFTMEFDQQLSAHYRNAAKREVPSLAMWENVLRFVGAEGIDQRRLPELSGISKSAVHSMLATLERHGWVVTKPSPADKRAKIVRLTPRGHKLWAVWEHAVAAAEANWRQRFGKSRIGELRQSLETITKQFEVELPHYPMAMAHRGGTPTGH